MLSARPRPTGHGHTLSASATPVVTHCLWSEKLPFAGYSVVKEPAASHRVLMLAAFDGQPSHRPAKAGGEYRARTGDLLVANQALSQLS